MSLELCSYSSLASSSTLCVTQLKLLNDIAKAFFFFFFLRDNTMNETQLSLGGVLCLQGEYSIEETPYQVKIFKVMLVFTVIGQLVNWACPGKHSYSNDFPFNSSAAKNNLPNGLEKQLLLFLQTHLSQILFFFFF